MEELLPYPPFSSIPSTQLYGISKTNGTFIIAFLMVQICQKRSKRPGQGKDFTWRH